MILFLNFLSKIIFLPLYTILLSPWSNLRLFLLLFSVIYFTTRFFLKKWPSLPCFFKPYSKNDKKKYFIHLNHYNSEDDLSSSSLLCLICGDLSCLRHTKKDLVDLQPWKKVLIDKNINESLIDLLETILDNFILKYYSEIQIYCKNDENFKSEVRYFFKHLISNLLIRILNLDFNNFLYHKIIPLLIQHFQFFLKGKRNAKSQQFIEKAVLGFYMKNNLFCKNLKSKNDEVKWIRVLVENLMPYCFPPKTIYSNLSKIFLREIFTCCIVFPVIEISTNPNYVNEILLLIFDEKNSNLKKECLKEKQKFVEILNNYELRKCDNDTENSEKLLGFLGISFEDLLKNQQLLIIFFQYLKEEGSINLLQFVLTMENFYDKLFDPEISENEMKELQADANHVLKNYLLPSGSDYLELQNDVSIQELKSILDSDYKNILKLQNFKPLLELSEKIYKNLKNFHFLQFLNSGLYLKMIVGSRFLNNTEESKNEKFFLAEELCDISSNQEDLLDINKVFKDDEYIFDYGIDLIDIIDKNSDNSNDLGLKENEKIKDLSLWKLSINRIETKIEHTTFKYYYVFQIEVTSNQNKNISDQSIDFNEINKNRSWIVERKYEEFYVLDEKLKKFHGNALNKIVGLSSKRTLFKQSLSFLESKKLEFENYLTDLINIPALKHSELIYNFLKSPFDCTSHQDDIFNSKLVDINLKKIIRTVPAKFSQERGQHLDLFLQNFINSTEGQKVKGNIPNLKDIFNYVETSDQSSEECLENDFEFDLNIQSLNNQKSFQIDSIYNLMIIIITRIYNLKTYKNFILKILRFLQPILNNTVQNLFFSTLQTKIDKLLIEENIEECLSLLKKTLIEIQIEEKKDQDLINLDKQYKLNSQKTLKVLENYFNNFFPSFLAFLNTKNQTGYFLHSVFQYQLLNKQFFYLLLNLLFQDLFPEIVDKIKL